MLRPLLTLLLFFVVAPVVAQDTINNNCINKKLVYEKAQNYSLNESSHTELQIAATQINNLVEDSYVFIVDTKSATAVLLGQKNFHGYNDPSQWVETLISYAIQTPACQAQSTANSEGVDCSIILPNKIVTLTFRSDQEVAGNVVVGIFNRQLKILGSAQKLALNLSTFIGKIPSLWGLGAAPFAVLGLSSEIQQSIARVILFDLTHTELITLAQQTQPSCHDFNEVYLALTSLKLGSLFIESLNRLSEKIGDSIYILLGVFK